MARFFLQSNHPEQQTVTLSGDDAKHISKVLRLRPGEEIELVVGGRAHRASLVSVTASEVVASLLAELPSSESPLFIHLYQALPKSDKMDLIVQKATELGVQAITPVLSERVVARSQEAGGGQRVMRWQRIAAEAAKQTRRNIIPMVHQPIGLGELPEASDRLRLVAWELAEQPLSEILRTCGQKTAVDLLIGPEGGLAASEVLKLRELGFQSVSLGPRILRTETAPLVLVSILQYYLGDLGGKQ